MRTSGIFMLCGANESERWGGNEAHFSGSLHVEECIS